MIAIFKAGAAYTPLDPAHPKDRHRQIIEQSGAKIILTTEQFEKEITEIIPAENKTEISTFLIPKLINADSPAFNPELEIHPQSLAYVLFTSGSTGEPKGAMVEHIGMINHLFAKIEDLEITSGDLIAQNASQCFDISVWQFLCGLLAGAAVRIVNDEVRHDPQALMNLVEDEKVTVLEVVPSLLQILLEDFEHKKVEKPELKSLRWLIATGEALPPHFIKRWFKLYLQIPMLNAYGPTECSDDVTHHPIFAPLETGVTQTPIGKAVPNINMYVLDKNLLPVPVNVNGELYVGGIGVGRGYIGDPVKTAQTFVPDPFGKNAGSRLYKTGDLGNYMPDGTLKFLERIDHQVKIRGFRIELGEIESVLRQHKNIAEVVVVDREDSASGKILAAYFIERKDSAENQPDGQNIDDHIDQWKEVFDNVYKHEDNRINDAALNIRGWNNSYTGEQIPETEMSEWVQGTVGNILSLNPKRVLELGCGTGMLLYRIAPHCEKYWGSDLAPESIHYLQELLAETPLENVDIKLLHRAADNFEAIEKNAFDTIVINSVAQYFPNVEYLLKVIENAAGVLDKGGKIYLGDIRNLKLLEALHFSIEAFNAKENLNRRQLKQTIKEKIREEDELLLDQNFFYALSKTIPRLTNVKISTKRGYAHNELTGFRYDVVLSFDDEFSEQKLQIEKLNWKAAELSLEKLKEKLARQNSPRALVVRDVPNARTISEAEGLKWLNAASDEDLLVDFKNEFEKRRIETIDPEKIKDILGESDYKIFSSAARSGAEGNFDLIAVKNSAASEQNINSLLKEFAPAFVKENDWENYSNNPLEGIASAALVPKLKEHLVEKLPEYMIPSYFIRLEKMPLTANGKIDRKALPNPQPTEYISREKFVEARNPIEESVTKIWQMTLGLNRIGIHDKFFDIGGDSLKIVRVFRLLEKEFPNTTTVVDLFKNNSIAEISEHIENRIGKDLSAKPVVGFEL